MTRQKRIELEPFLTEEGFETYSEMKDWSRNNPQLAEQAFRLEQGASLTAVQKLPEDDEFVVFYEVPGDDHPTANQRRGSV